MITLESLIYPLKALVSGSIFFVWVIRYQNIVQEFKDYRLPPWLRDLVGILKLSFVLMLYSSDANVILLGSGGISILMIAAILTHLRVKSPFYKMAPSMSLMIISSGIFIFTFLNLTEYPSLLLNP